MNSARGRMLRVASGLGLALLLTASPAGAGGLRCSLGEVVLDNLKIGHTYSLSTLASIPLSVTSSDAAPLRVRIEPLVPDVSELRGGAEAAAAPSWASAFPETLDLLPNQTRLADL